MLPERKKAIYFKFLLFLVLLPLTVSACAKKHPSETIAIRISDYTLTAGEFEELFHDLKGVQDTPQAREAFLDNLITRKLLLKEAQKLGLDKQKDFLKSIENFWEQSLLKVIITKKINEISPTITVTEREIADRYNKWAHEDPENPKTLDELRDIIRRQLLNEKQTLAVDSWVDSLQKETNIEVDKKAIGIE